MDFPVYDMTLSEDSGHDGVFAISIVDKPAIQHDFLKLGKDIKLSSISNADKQIVTGVALIPDTPIYRRVNKEEFYIQFSKDTILQTVEKFMGNSNNSAVTLSHNEKTHSVDIIESWIVEDSSNDKLVALGLEAPVGAWAVSMKVNDKELWDEIKNGDSFNGFSIEGLYKKNLIDNEKVIEMAQNADFTERLDKLEDLLTKLTEQNKTLSKEDIKPWILEAIKEAKDADEDEEDLEDDSKKGDDDKKDDKDDNNDDATIMSAIEKLEARIDSLIEKKDEDEDGVLALGHKSKNGDDYESWKEEKGI